MRMTWQEILDTAAQNADLATIVINRDRDAGGAIALSTLAIAQALTAIGIILRETTQPWKDGPDEQRCENCRDWMTCDFTRWLDSEQPRPFRSCISWIPKDKDQTGGQKE